ncbi:MAG: TonB-dependent receptor [bacterium]|nr:TonB-dependent receptor [candidate division KSB1 bacterium]MDH7559994.1 TonB-dependent receptor [bacterium]
MRGRCLLLAAQFVLPGASLLAGTTGTLTGTVVDKTTKEPLAGVNVVLVSTRYGAATNSEGRFFVYHLPAGTYTVRVSMIGYVPCEVRDVRIIMDLKTSLEVELEPQVLDLGQIVVATAERPLIQRDVTGSTHLVAGSKLDDLPVDSFRDLLVLQPGVTADGHIRGGRDTEVLYLVDGLPIQDAMMGGQSSDLPNASVVELTVQTGGFNAEYGNAMSGIVNVVTKSGSDRFEAWLRALDDRLGVEESNHLREYEVLASGPLKRERATYFVSSNLRLSDTRWWQDMVPVFGSPIEKNLNLVAKVKADLTRDLRTVYQVLYSDWDWHDYEYRWRYNLAGLPPRWKQSYRLSATLTHTPRKWLFCTVNLGRYFVHHRMGQGDKSQVDPSQAFQYELPWYYFIISGRRLWWQEARQTTYVAKADLTAQLGEIHQVKCGGELQYFDLYNDLVKYEPQKTFWGRPLIDRPLLNFSSTYRYQPWQAALYAQDKIDNGIFVANVGVRYDVLNPRAERPVVEWIPVTQEEFRQEVKTWVPASIKHQLSPRVGLAFPVGSSGFFFVNFGYFFQVPLFDYMYTGLHFDLKKGIRLLYGNPDLKPERTKAYEFSYKHSLRQDVLLSLTYFQKEMSGLVDTKTFLATDSKAEDDGFTQYVNLPAARSSGLEVVVEKRYSAYCSGKVSYTYMLARGYSGNAQQGLNYFMWGFEVPNQEYYLSWDQRHTLVVEGFVGKLRRWGVNVVWRWNSPRPYTYYPSRTGILPDLTTKLIPNNRRMSEVSCLDVKFSTELRLARWATLGCYLDVRNILDRANILWVASDGKPGGELGDCSAWDVGRRVNLGVRLVLGAQR